MHDLALEKQQVVETFAVSLTPNSIKAFNAKFIAANLLERVEQGGMLKNL